MNEIEIDLITATMRPGDTLSGVVHVHGAGEPLVHLTLQGEEVLGAGNLGFQYVVPFFELTATVDCSEGPAAFQFVLPKDLPPTYFSQDLRCLYVLKARRKGAGTGLPFFRRDAIHRINIPVLALEGTANREQHWFVLPAGGVELEVRLDSCQVEAGQALTGELKINKVSDGPLPRSLSFRFAAIEESTQKEYNHRKVTSLQTQDITPEAELEYPMQGFFEFPIDLSAPASGQWNTFKVHYGFRVGMTLSNGEQVRQSLPIEVCRYPAEVFTDV
ncbi:hypothetical protein ABS71_16540 [bacterium SCN 62-11]|nr:hypothetical protein [Candidatus Eremiobacteraeota bacterium]ODT61893.1 MAG: hypothetical protein ABS71_16540 [bacterium SCN 62-11]